MCRRALLHLAGIAAALVISGCCGPRLSPLFSFNPIVTDSTALYDSSLAGTWIWSPGASGDTCSNASRWVLTAAPGGRSYQLEWPVVREKTATRTVIDTFELEVQLTRIGAHQYLDVWNQDFDAPLVLPVHMVMRIDRRGDTMTVITVAPKDADSSAAWSDVTHASIDDMIILSASTAQLRDWIERRFKANAFGTARSTALQYLHAVYVRQGAAVPEPAANRTPFMRR